ncbi:hypothetical protein GYMLUDRAFT_246024 [Collybiopsis luxurians FD-317 M1]|uniref:Uncharacterized protein n=1 Tax=Collybiopsis luxurians FD-317 M1 TaxID=944289 RepID=A0A0D0C822_9AGAR|nr:hypothetical protein GYMLUDRAFT_246024 [Collybiopsis luxurians FD-317 M1]
MFDSVCSCNATNDGDVDSVSDTESSVSLFSESSSTESMTSVSSTSSPSKSSKLPLPTGSVLAPAGLKAPVYVPRHRRAMPFSPSTDSAYSSPPDDSAIRSQSCLTRVIVDKSKHDIRTYTYPGGRTSVITGGVMLGIIKPTAAQLAMPGPDSFQTSFAHSATTQLAKARSQSNMDSTRFGSDSDSSKNWRIRA